MKVHIITLFPDSFSSYFSSSIMKRAIEGKLLEVFFYDLWQFAQNTWGRLDDKAYGMHGQVMIPGPISDAIESIFQKVGKKIPVIYFTPRWEVLTQVRLEKYSRQFSSEYILLCGHYEGIDQRIIDHYVDLQVSIWKYVLTSWELGAMVFLDGVTRLIPGVLGNELSHIEESFSKKLNRQKEYPVYTRPQEFLWLRVPDVLISWHHKEIEKWKMNNLW